MNNLIDQLYGQFSEDQLDQYEALVGEALSKGLPPQMVYQYFLQATYAALEQLGNVGLNQQQQNQVAVQVAHKLYMRATGHGKGDNNSSAGSNQEHSELLRSTQSEPGNDKDDEGV